jgi:hypothetical protein
MPIEEFAVTDDKRVAVTLVNGRSHVVDLPENVAPGDAAAAIRGDRSAGELGWPEGDGAWLAFGNGQGWVRRESIAEVMLVEYFPDESHRVYE